MDNAATIAELYRLRKEAHDEREVLRKFREIKHEKSAQQPSKLAEYYAGLECAYMRAIVLLENGEGPQRS
jgi:hypothetical protein